MFEIKDLTKRYGGLTVYDGFNLNIESGKITCILGESGSGKTTLLNCVAGLINYEGSITQAKCSYVFQEAGLVPNLTVCGNLMLICKDAQKIDKMLERLHLSDKSSSYPAQLSGGEAQRVALARAFLYNGQIMLLDEPFSSLDLKLKRKIVALFLELWHEHNLTVLFVTHDVDEAISIADRIVVLNKGKIVFDKEYDRKMTADSTYKNAMREELISALL